MGTTKTSPNVSDNKRRKEQMIDPRWQVAEYSSKSVPTKNNMQCSSIKLSPQAWGVA